MTKDEIPQEMTKKIQTEEIFDRVEWTELHYIRTTEEHVQNNWKITTRFKELGKVIKLIQNIKRRCQMRTLLRMKVQAVEKSK